MVSLYLVLGDIEGWKSDDCQSNIDEEGGNVMDSRSLIVSFKCVECGFMNRHAILGKSPERSMGIVKCNGCGTHYIMAGVPEGFMVWKITDTSAMPDMTKRVSLVMPAATALALMLLREQPGEFDEWYKEHDEPVLLDNDGIVQLWEHAVLMTDIRGVYISLIEARPILPQAKKQFLISSQAPSSNEKGGIRDAILATGVDEENELVMFPDMEKAVEFLRMVVSTIRRNPDQFAEAEDVKDGAWRN